MKTRCVVAALAAWAVIACRMTDAQPAALDAGHEACGYCRMVIADTQFASQIVVPYEEPMFFDDLGCLRKHLEGSAPLPDSARIYVADHRTRRWVLGDSAVYTQVDAISAPMGSHVLAHESAASRDADPAAAGGLPVSPAIVSGRRPHAGDRP